MNMKANCKMSRKRGISLKEDDSSTSSEEKENLQLAKKKKIFTKWKSKDENYFHTSSVIEYLFVHVYFNKMLWWFCISKIR